MLLQINDPLDLDDVKPGATIAIAEGLNLYDIDFSHTFLSQTYNHVSFDYCKFENVFARRAIFNHCTFTGCDFSLATFNYARFNKCEFRDCKWEGTNLKEIRWNQSNADNVCIMTLRWFTAIATPYAVTIGCQKHTYDYWINEEDYFMQHYSYIDNSDKLMFKAFIVWAKNNLR